MGLAFEALANDSLAEKRSEYLAVVEQCAAARLNRVNLDAVNAPTAESSESRACSLLSKCRSRRHSWYQFPTPPRILQKRSLSMPDERTLVSSRALVKVIQASQFTTVHVQAVPTVSRQAFVKTSRLAEEYLVHEMIGKGGFGEVFKVVHKLDHVCKLFWSFRA
jgi:hypothetical protein